MLFVRDESEVQLQIRRDSALQAGIQVAPRGRRVRIGLTSSGALSLGVD